MMSGEPRPRPPSSRPPSSRPPSSLGTAASRLDEIRRREESRGNIRLQKKIGLVSGVGLIVGTMIGSGIFISPKGVAEGSGSVGLSLIVWIICGVIALCGAMSYAELGTMIHKSGAEYSYLLEAFGPLHGTLGDIPAFLSVWTNIFLLKPASVAIIMLTFATYATEPFYDTCSASVGAQKCLAALGIIILTMANCLSVRLATGLQNVLTGAKLLAVVIIVIACFVKLGQGSTAYLASGFDGTRGDIGQLAIGVYKGMWAYDGWNNLNFVTEEIRNPFVNLPRAILIGIPLVTLCYLLVNISYFTVMSVPELIESPAVALTWSEHVLPNAKWVIPLFVAMSTFGSVKGSLFTAERLSYAAGREGHMVELLSMIHVRKHTPMPSLILTAALSLVFIIPGDISSLIDFFNFAVWFFYGGTMTALLVLRYTQPDTTRPFKVPIFIPIIVLVVSVFLVIVPIASSPSVEFLYAFLFIISGFIFYIPFVYLQKTPAFVEPFTAFFQLLMEVTPPSAEPGSY